MDNNPTSPTVEDMEKAIMAALQATAQASWLAARATYATYDSDRHHAETAAAYMVQNETSVAMWRMLYAFVGANTPPF